MAWNVIPNTRFSSPTWSEYKTRRCLIVMLFQFPLGNKPCSELGGVRYLGGKFTLARARALCEISWCKSCCPLEGGVCYLKSPL